MKQVGFREAKFSIARCSIVRKGNQAPIHQPRFLRLLKSDHHRHTVGTQPDFVDFQHRGGEASKIVDINIIGASAYSEVFAEGVRTIHRRMVSFFTKEDQYSKQKLPVTWKSCARTT